jgi:hypothetical protein
MALVVGVVVGLLYTSALAQREPGSLTVGAQVGRTGGLSLKLYAQPPHAYQALFTFDGDDFARLSLSRVWERPLPDSLVYAYYGPGLRLGGRELKSGPSTVIELLGTVGLNFYAERFEVFLHVTPALRLQPNLRPRLGGGVGLRYDLF